jgi:hypothetical protein
MGASHGDFIKYPRTPHLFGSKGTDDDKHLSEAESNRFIADDSLIVEEKIDGTNVGIHFSDEGELVLQCRGHLITEAIHPQYDLFKQWATVKRYVLEQRLENRFLLFGEWMYARHSVHYRQLTHYFFEFDIYDKEIEAFLDLERRLDLLAGAGIETVPVLHQGALKRSELETLIGPSKFDSQFELAATYCSSAGISGISTASAQTAMPACKANQPACCSRTSTTATFRADWAAWRALSSISMVKPSAVLNPKEIRLRKLP